MLLPNPINQKIFDATINHPSTQGLKLLPWQIFSGTTVVIWFMWVIAFLMSVINCFTPIEAPTFELTNYYKYWYVQEVPSDDRRLAGTGQFGVDYPPVPQNTSSVRDVADWLEIMGHPTVAEAAFRGALMELPSETSTKMDGLLLVSHLVLIEP